MSADNWAYCPRCLQRARKEHDDICIKFSSAYGNVPEEEYNELAARVDGGLRRPEVTLREDLEIGIYGTDFVALYRASCTVCGFTHKFEHEEKLNLEEDNDD